MSYETFSVHYCSHNSVLVINPVGKLRRLYTPFRVFSQSTDSGKRKAYIVEEVFSDNSDKLFYLINGKAYQHSYFTIEIQF